MDYWYHIINSCPSVAYSLLERNYITTGFSDIAIQYPKIVNESFSKMDIKRLVLYSYQNRNDETLFVEIKGKNSFKQRTLPVSGTLFNFIYEFKIGDRILVSNYPVKDHFVVFETLTNADLIGNLPIKKFVDLDGKEVSLEDGLLRWDYINFIDIGFFIKVKPLTVPIDGVFKRPAATNRSLNDMGDQIEEFITDYKI